jgi:cytochrome d ubiquinol oxidase subunit I
LLTESGRQPWIVQGLMKTADGVSPSVSTTDVVISLVVFYGIYIALGAVTVFLMLRFARRGLELEPDETEPAEGSGPRVPALTY